MKPLFASISVFLLLVLAINIFMDPLGFFSANTRKLIQENNKNCVIDIKLVRGTAQRFMKEELLRRESPAVVALGTSRVLRLHRESFHGKSFLSYGLISSSPQEMFTVTKALAANSKLKLVLFGLDVHLFIKRYEPFNAPVRNAIAHHLPTSIWKSMEYFDSAAASIRWLSNMLWKYLSFPLAKQSLEQMIASGGWGAKTYLLDLPMGSAAESHCIISSTSELNDHGAWDPIDGSEYSREELLGKAISVDLSIYSRDLVEGQYWKVYHPNDTLSDLNLFYLRQSIQLLRAKGVQVIGFTPPFPDRVKLVFKEHGILPLFIQFEQRMAALFQEEGFVFIPSVSGSELGCDDLRDYHDPWHPSAKCMNRELERLRAKSGFNF